MIAVADHAPDVTTPFAKLIPEILDVFVDATLIVPPMKALPVIAKPPRTCNEPVVVEVDCILPPTETPVPVN